MKKKEKKTPLQKALGKQYLERSLFFYQSVKAARLSELLEEISTIDDRSLNWSLDELGIDPEASAFVTRSQIRRPAVFCHPEVIQKRPHLVLYYRNIAGLTQKGLGKLAVPVSDYEKGIKDEISQEDAQRIAHAINVVMSSIILGDQNFKETDVHRNMLASLGVTIDGSWRNRIGGNVTREVNKLFVAYLKARKLIAKQQKMQLFLKNGTLVRFGSDPDVAISSPAGKLLVAIEVKGGIDAAGALERYGAARKSFDKARKANVRCHTIYLASCITPTVRERIEQDGLVSEIQDLLEILSSPKKARSFLDDLFNHVVRI